MMRAWIGVALLAAAWLLGTTYYQPGNQVAWLATVVAATLLLGGLMRRGPTRREASLALMLLLPAAWWAPWPLRAAPLWLMAGLAAELLPIPREGLRRLGRGAMAAGVVLLAQAVAMAAHGAWTARSHELPWPLPALLATVARLFGIEAVADGSNIVMHSIRQTHRLGATWDLLLDPATLCFLVGSLVVLGLATWASGPVKEDVIASSPGSGTRRLAVWGRAAAALVLVVAVWLPLRSGLLMAVYLQRVLRTGYDTPLHAMNHFLSPWVLLALLAPPVLLAWRFVRWPGGDGAEEEGDRSVSAPRESGRSSRWPQGHSEPAAAGAKPWLYPAAVVLVMLAVGVLTAAFTWDPVGTPRAGRVVVVERHSTWEPTTRPYDTQWFGHDASYNYAAAFDYLDQFFEVSRLLESDKIDRASLDQCDVLVIKTPTARYTADEIEAVVRFVERGGGLLLVGDHTNVFNSGTYMNDVARHFGFTFRDDLLFGTGESPYDQRYVAGYVPHPIVAHLPPTDFAVSCSIDPGHSWGRAAVRAAGLWSMPPDYHMDNYHPVPQHGPEIRYGEFIQLWTTRAGRGRVAAFGDSTIFSSFCIFQPGKAELLRGMIDWLNHGDAGDPGPWLLAAGAVLLVLGLAMALAMRARARQRDPAVGAGRGRWLVLLAAGVCGWAVAGMAVAAAGRANLPVPPIRSDARRPCVVVDRATSRVPLSKGAFPPGDETGYGLFEQWISRVAVPCDGIERNLWTTRRTGAEVFSGDALVVVCPDRPVTDEYRERLVRYVRDGGRLLVLDSPENTTSTANSLLWPFGLSILRNQAWQGQLTLAEQWPGIDVASAWEVAGGQPVGRLGDRPVAAVANAEKTGKGLVMAVGFGSLFTDAAMGTTWLTHPNAQTIVDRDTYRRYNVEFALLRALMTGQPVSEFLMGRVVVDRTLTRVFTDADGLDTADRDTADQDTADRFETMTRWIERLGYHVDRVGGAASAVAADETFSGDALVIVCPSEHIEAGFRSEILDFVAAGGRLLVVDSPTNPMSTANDLLRPLGVSFGAEPAARGPLVVETEERAMWPWIESDSALPVGGGRPFAYIGPTPVGATLRHGKGTVTLVGFGSLLSDASMGRAESRSARSPAGLVPYDVWSAVVRAVLSGQAVAKTVSAGAAAP